MRLARATTISKTFISGTSTESFIRGHECTFVKSQPGIIIRALREVQARDCVMLLHEIDKLGGGHFAVLEQPMVFVVELRAAFRALPLGG